MSSDRGRMGHRNSLGYSRLIIKLCEMMHEGDDGDRDDRFISARTYDDKEEVWFNRSSCTHVQQQPSIIMCTCTAQLDSQFIHGNTRPSQDSSTRCTFSLQNNGVESFKRSARINFTFVAHDLTA